MTKLGIVLGSVVCACGLLFSEKSFRPSEKNTGMPQEITSQVFLSYADSVDNLLTAAKKQNSLLFTKGNYSFQIEKYIYKGEPVLYIEKGNSNAGGQVEKRYYVKGNTLSLYKENVRTEDPAKPCIATHAYFKNNSLIFAEQKTALSDSGLKTVSFQKTDIVKKDQAADLAMLEDALQQRGDFNLVFDGIADYPKAKYIILSKSGINAYRAPIRVENEDEFVHELSTNTSEHRGEKLNINWQNSDTNGVVYLSGKPGND